MTNIEVSKYISSFPSDVRERLAELRKIVFEIYPEAEEVISYGIPTYRVNSKNFIHFGAYPNHISIYPVPQNRELVKKLADKIKGKGTIQFPLTEEIDYTLVREIAAAHYQETLRRMN